MQSAERVTEAGCGVENCGGADVLTCDGAPLCLEHWKVAAFWRMRQAELREAAPLWALPLLKDT